MGTVIHLAINYFPFIYISQLLDFSEEFVTLNGDLLCDVLCCLLFNRETLLGCSNFTLNVLQTRLYTVQVRFGLGCKDVDPRFQCIPVSPMY